MFWLMLYFNRKYVCNMYGNAYVLKKRAMASVGVAGGGGAEGVARGRGRVKRK